MSNSNNQNPATRQQKTGESQHKTVQKYVDLNLTLDW